MQDNSYIQTGLTFTSTSDLNRNKGYEEYDSTSMQSSNCQCVPKNHDLEPAKDSQHLCQEEKQFYRSANLIYNSNQNDQCLLMNDNEETVMSFVGIGYFQSNIIGFADHRSSRTIQNVLTKDPCHSPVQKLWSTKTYVTVFYGSNSFISLDNEKSDQSKFVYIEDWLNDNIDLYSTPTDLITELFRYMRNESLADFGDVVCLSGEWKDGHVILLKSVINRSSVKFENLICENGCFIVGGVQLYQDLFLSNLQSALTLKEDDLKNMLNGLIHQYDAIQNGRYNPVGDEWDIVMVPDKL